MYSTLARIVLIMGELILSAVSIAGVCQSVPQCRGASLRSSLISLIYTKNTYILSIIYIIIYFIFIFIYNFYLFIIFIFYYIIPFISYIFITYSFLSIIVTLLLFLSFLPFTSSTISLFNLRTSHLFSS